MDIIIFIACIVFGYYLARPIIAIKRQVQKIIKQRQERQRAAKLKLKQDKPHTKR